VRSVADRLEDVRSLHGSISFKFNLASGAASYHGIFRRRLAHFKCAGAAQFGE